MTISIPPTRNYHPRKNNRVYIRLDNEQSKKIQDKADKLGMSIGTYLRFLGLNVDLEVNKFVRQKMDKPF